jgi:hypothetical protein
MKNKIITICIMAPPTPRMNRLNRISPRPMTPNSPFNTSRNNYNRITNTQFHYTFEVLVRLFPYASPFEKSKMLKDFVKYTEKHYHQFTPSQLSRLYNVYSNLKRQYRNNLNRVQRRQVQRGFHHI